MDATHRLNISAFSTRLGFMAFACADEQLYGLVIGHPSRRSAVVALAPILSLDDTPSLDTILKRAKDFAPADSWSSDLVERLERFSDGELVDFADVTVDLAHQTAFGRRVVVACRQISYGQTIAYGKLAARCGSPGAARAVGQIMAGNRYPLVVPCHRVVGAGGRLGGFSAPQGTRLKRRLLEMESGDAPTRRTPTPLCGLTA